MPPDLPKWTLPSGQVRRRGLPQGPCCSMQPIAHMVSKPWDEGLSPIPQPEPHETSHVPWRTIKLRRCSCIQQKRCGAPFQLPKGFSVLTNDIPRRVSWCNVSQT